MSGKLQITHTWGSEYWAINKVQDLNELAGTSLSETQMSRTSMLVVYIGTNPTFKVEKVPKD